jgi:glycine oxidase
MIGKFDVLIIGNGILGTSTAYALALQDPTLRIAVVGPYPRLGGATVAAGAMLSCFAELDKFSFSSKYSLNKFTMARQSAKQWPSWLNQINATLALKDQVTINPGTFVLLNTKAGRREDENFSAISETLKYYKEPHEAVDPAKIPGIYPLDDARPLRALYLPNEGALNPYQLLAALEKASVQNGVVFLDASVNKILLDKERAVGIETELGEILHASSILLAAGAFSQTLLEQIPFLENRIPKVMAGWGCSLILKPDSHQIKNVIRSPNRSGSCGIHMLPYGENSNLLYMGASNNVRFSPKMHPKGRDVYYLLERAIEQFHQDLHKAEIIQWQIGNRPVSFDTFPLIGSTSVNGLWLLTGTYRDGIQDSPLLASSIAREILGGTPLFEHAFKPERFPISIMSQEQSIEEFSDQYVSVGYEQGMRLPKLSWVSIIKEKGYMRAKFLYDALEIDIGLSPDVLFMLDQMPELIPSVKQHYQALQRNYSSHTLIPAIIEE